MSRRRVDAQRIAELERELGLESGEPVANARPKRPIVRKVDDPGDVGERLVALGLLTTTLGVVPSIILTSDGKDGSVFTYGVPGIIAGTLMALPVALLALFIVVGIFVLTVQFILGVEFLPSDNEDDEDVSSPDDGRYDAGY